MSNLGTQNDDNDLVMALSTLDARLGDILLRQGVISRDNLELAFRESSGRKMPLREVLTGLGICIEDQINWAVSRELQIPFVLLTSEMIEQEIIKDFPLELLLESKALPIPDALGGITLVMGDPLDERSFRKLADLKDEEIRRAVGPLGRILSIIDQLIHEKAGENRFVSETVSKDTSGVAAAYGMIVAARKVGANRILMRPAGDGLESAFRLERGWVLHRVWSRDQSLAVISRIRILMGLSPSQNLPREISELKTKIGGERLTIEAKFTLEPEGPVVDIVMYPIVTTFNLKDFDNLAPSQREALERLFTARRPTGVILVNAPDQRQRYRMIYGLLASIFPTNFDILSLEERKYFESPAVRRKGVVIDSAEWHELVTERCDVLAICDTPYWHLRDLIGTGGERLVIIGCDLVSTWLAFRSVMDAAGSTAMVADRLRAIWSGRRVDLTCSSCGGEVAVGKGKEDADLCPSCNGYGHDRGADVFEVAIVGDAIRGMLAGRFTWDELQKALQASVTAPSIEAQIEEGLRSRRIFNIYGGGEE